MNSQEHNQMESEQYRAEMESREGVYDVGVCDGGCSPTRMEIGRQLVKTWTAEGFRLRFGDEMANPFLNAARNADGITLSDVDQVSLCFECEWHPENWSEI